MRLLFVLTALICGLLPTGSQADDDNQIKMVPTLIGISVTDRAGQPLFSPDSVVEVIWDQFGKKPWPEKYWASMVIDSQSVRTLVQTQFPINQSKTRWLWVVSKFVRKPRIPIGFYIRDGRHQPLVPPGGVRIVIWQLGPDPWPEELWVTVEGELDQTGHIVVPVNFPLTGTVVKNLTNLAKSQE